MTTTIKSTDPSPTRATVTRLATAAVLAAMALNAAGGTAAADTHAPLPSFTGYGNGSGNDSSSSDGDSSGDNTVSLDSLLLTGKAASSVIGVNGLRQRAARTHLADSSSTVSPASCISTYSPAQAAAYNSLTVQAVSERLLEDPSRNHAITEAVVAMGSKHDAVAMMKAAVANWKQCAGQTLTQTDDSGTTRQWTNDRPRINDDHTVLSLGQTSNDGATCERAMAAYSNVVIDVMSCAAGSTDGQAVAVANAIADRANTQTV